MIRGTGGQRIGAGQQVTQIPVTADEGFDPGLNQISGPGARGFPGRRFPFGADFKAFEKESPFPGDLVRVGLPKGVLGISSASRCTTPINVRRRMGSVR